MSDAIVRLRVESQEYDAKLKRATEGLTRYADECRKMGGTLEFVEKETLDYVKALGQMDTVSRTATGSLSEMKKTYTELAVQYEKLTAEEKKSPFGKAMAQSLEELKGRIREAKGNIDDVTNSMNGGLSRAVENITAKFGMNIKQLTGWGAALAAGKVALDVAKDAFNASEVAVDDWARTLDVGKSMYEGFLTALNTGDISGYVDRINEIVNAARLAYNELDRLRTMKTIQSPQKSAQQAENDRLRMMIQTGRYIAPLDGRKATMQNGQLLTPEQIKVLERQLQGGMQKMTNLVANEVKQSTRAINAVYDRQAKELGLTQKEFRAGTSSMAEFDKRIQGYQQYRAYERQHTIYDDRTGIGRRDTTTNPYESYKSWGVFRVDGDRYNQLVQLIQQRDQQMAQAYGMQNQAYRAINHVEGISSRGLMGGGGATTTKQPKTEIEQNQAKIKDLTQEYIKLGDQETEASKNRQIEIQKEIELLQKRNDLLGVRAEQAQGKYLGGDVQTTGLNTAGYIIDRSHLFDTGGGIGWQKLQKYNDQTSVSEYKRRQKENESKKEKDDVEKLNDFSKITNSVTNIASGLQSLGVEIPEGIAKTLGVIQTISGILSAILAITTVISATSQANATANWLDALIPFAHGGKVPHAANGYFVQGTRRSTDTTPILANAGELVLNESSQDNLALGIKNAEALVQTIDRYQDSVMRGSQAAGPANNIRGGNDAGGGSPYLTGEVIYLGLSAYLKSSGRGEIVTSRSRG